MAQIDYNFIKTQDFKAIIFKILDKVRMDYTQRKLKYYGNMIINYSTLEFSKELYKEGAVEKLGDYTVEHITVLDKIYEHQKSEAEKEIRGSMQSELKPYDEEAQKICIYDLNSNGFIEKVIGASGTETYHLTHNGIRFVKVMGEVS